MIKDGLGKRVKLARMKKGLTTRELAAQVGLRAHSQITFIENGTNLIPAKKLPLFAKALDVSVEYLIGEDKPIRLENQAIFTEKEKELLFERLGISKDNLEVAPSDGWKIEVDKCLDGLSEDEKFTITKKLIEFASTMAALINNKKE